MHLDQALFTLFILLTVVGLAVGLFRRLGLGSVLGLLVAGFVVGPSGLAITQRVTELRQSVVLPFKGMLLGLFFVAIGMGEFGFVLFGAAVAAGLMSDHGFVCAALLISMSMAASPLLVRLSDRLAGVEIASRRSASERR